MNTSTRALRPLQSSLVSQDPFGESSTLRCWLLLSRGDGRAVQELIWLPWGIGAVTYFIPSPHPRGK